MNSKLPYKYSTWSTYPKTPLSSIHVPVGVVKPVKLPPGLELRFVSAPDEYRYTLAAQV